MSFDTKVAEFRVSHPLLSKVPLLAKFVVGVGVLFGKIVNVFSKKEGLPPEVNKVDKLGDQNIPKTSPISGGSLEDHKVTDNTSSGPGKIPSPVKNIHAIEAVKLSSAGTEQKPVATYIESLTEEKERAAVYTGLAEFHKLNGRHGSQTCGEILANLSNPNIWNEFKKVVDENKLNGDFGKNEEELKASLPKSSPIVSTPTNQEIIEPPKDNVSNLEANQIPKVHFEKDVKENDGGKKMIPKEGGVLQIDEDLPGISNDELTKKCDLAINSPRGALEVFAKFVQTLSQNQRTFVYNTFTSISQKKPKSNTLMCAEFAVFFTKNLQKELIEVFDKNLNQWDKEDFHAILQSLNTEEQNELIKHKVVSEKVELKNVAPLASPKKGILKKPPEVLPNLDASPQPATTSTTSTVLNPPISIPSPLKDIPVIPKVDKPLAPEEKVVLDKFTEGLKTLDPKVSYVFLHVPFVDKKGEKHEVGFWTQDQMSDWSGYPLKKDSSGLNLKEKAEKNLQTPFLFSILFGNARGTIPDQEPPILMPNPFKEFGANTPPLEFHNAEFYFQFMKNMILFHQGQKKEDALIKDIQNEKWYRAVISEGMGVDGPGNAANYGRNIMLSPEALKFFEAHRVEIMTSAIYAKAVQNPLFAEMLKASGDKTLAQLKTDPIWGPLGLNLLGVCLASVRTALLKNETIEPFDLKGKMETWNNGVLLKK